MQWVQLLNPMLNPDLTNTHATCVNCPYTSDHDPDGNPIFFGLQYNGQTALADGNAAGNFMELGAMGYPAGQKTPCMLGPQLKNDLGSIEYPTLVELFVRPDPSGAACIDCKACFDPDGEVRLRTWPKADGTSYQGPACPDYCLDAVKPKPKQFSIRAPHQLVIDTKGLRERGCHDITTYNNLESKNESTTICEGVATKLTDAVPSTLAFGRNGGVITQAYFVAPRDASYSFNVRLSDGGELWLSPNADPRAAVREISVLSQATGSTGSTAPDGSLPSAFCAAWSQIAATPTTTVTTTACVGTRCFRAFGGYLDHDNAASACSEYGAVLAAPRNSNENAAIAKLIKANSWLGNKTCYHS